MTDEEKGALAEEAMRITAAYLYDDGRCDEMDMSSHSWAPSDSLGWHTPADAEGVPTADGSYLNIVCGRCSKPMVIQRGIAPDPEPA